MYKELSAITTQRSKTVKDFQPNTLENCPPKEHTSIIRAKRKDGWTYVQRVVSDYDPKIKNSKRLSTEYLGKLPPGETDLEKLVPLEPRRRKGSLKADKISAPAQKVADPRDQSRIIYPLDIVFCVILLAAMEGKTSCTEIAEFWRQCRPLLSKTFPDFPDEEISHDTVRRITMIIGKDKNAALVERFVEILRSKLSHPVIAVDGQAARASRNSAEHSPYVLNIMDADKELILAQQVIGDKNNEITHATKLISTLDIQGAIVTADALNTQTEFAAKIIAEKADYCLALKANQDLTYEQVRGFFELGTHDYKTARPSVTDQSDKITKRKTRVLPGSLLPKEIRDKWVGLEEGSIVETVTDTVRKSTSEVLVPQVRYYISSLRYEAPNVEQVLHRAVRQHWTIENKGHWALDMAFNQDQSTSEVLVPQVRYYISSLRYEAPNVEQVLHRAVRQHWTIENKGHWALDMAFNQDRLQCTNAQYLAGRTLLNKIALNFTTKIQTRLEEATGKAAPSKPIIRVRLRKIEDMLAAMNDCIRI